jgi:IclR family pca regulon transcriptional regulator
VSAPPRDGEGQVIVALNVTVPAAKPPIEALTGEYLPLLLQGRGRDQRRLGRLPGRPQLVKPGGGRVSAERTG